MSDTKLISNKDGTPYVFGSFSSASPSTYRAVKDGEIVGHVEKRAYNLSLLNPNWHGIDDCWVLSGNDGVGVFASQFISDIRAYLRGQA